MTGISEPVRFDGWVDEHRHLLRPPVGNKQLHEGAEDLIVMVVGGPNQRQDYHVDPYEEWFFQIKGDIHVHLVTDEGPRTVHIREGESWLLPAGVPHSPQRPQEGSIGLVVEQVRKAGTLEKFQWYAHTADSATLVHEVELQVTDIRADLPPVFAEFYEKTLPTLRDADGAPLSRAALSPVTAVPDPRGAETATT
ncbi:3-hydroxyanthranilate 3,4-dioxygenase [Pseudonocardia yuanmonensis]|uniref:3-hydroxyanthranilate 3,4-dioxygenase n=1 Tax=Pseudonocardia yuanmonensis TaxID=1095914 RepID=A0ABP8WN76_9PSEU